MYCPFALAEVVRVNCVPSLMRVTVAPGTDAPATEALATGTLATEMPSAERRWLRDNGIDWDGEPA